MLEEVVVVKGKLEWVMKCIQEGEDFEIVVCFVFDDQFVKNNGGWIGYVFVFFFNGFYELEKVVYEVLVGELSGLICMDVGFYVLLVYDCWLVWGEVEAVYILLCIDGDEEEKMVKACIDSVYQVLEVGVDFDVMVKVIFEDLCIVLNGGYIGFFGINCFFKDFEEVVFGLKEEGSYSKFVKISVGWYIFKLIFCRGI